MNGNTKSTTYALKVRYGCDTAMGQTGLPCPVSTHALGNFTKILATVYYPMSSSSLSKSSERAAILDPLNANIAKALEVGTKAKHSFRLTLDWLSSYEKHLFKVVEFSRCLQRTEAMMHPSLLAVASSTGEKLLQAMSSFHTYVVQILPPSKKLKQDLKKKLKNIKTALKRQAQQVQTSHQRITEIIMSFSKTVTLTGDETLALGFQMHSSIISYAVAISAIERQMVETFQILLRSISEVRQYERTMCNYINSFAKRLPFSADSSGRQDEHAFAEDAIQQRIRTIKDFLMTCRVLSHPSPDYYSFDCSGIKSNMKMIVTEDFHGEVDEEELPLAHKDDLVDVVDASLPEFWKVKDCFGKIGYVSVSFLKPAVSL
jgi:hypothetical protein